METQESIRALEFIKRLDFDTQINFVQFLDQNFS